MSTLDYTERYRYLEFEHNGFRVKALSKDIYSEKHIKEIIETMKGNPVNGDIIYDVRNRLTLFKKETLGFFGEDIVVKEFLLKRRYDRLRYRFIKSKAFRSMEIALQLKKAGVKTPEPLMAIEVRGDFNKLSNSYFITSYLNYDYNLLDIITDDSHPLRRRVIEFLPYIARDAKKLHDTGIVHNDLHAGNILLKDIDTNPAFYYIDLNRARKKRKLSCQQRMRDLARFELKEEELKTLIKNYEPDNFKKFFEEFNRQKRRRQKAVQRKRYLRKLRGRRKI